MERGRGLTGSPASSRRPATSLALHPDAGAFLSAARAELELREAEHSLVLGSALALQAGGAPARAPQLLATVHDDAGVALAALRSAPHPLLLASNRAEAGAALAALVEHLAAAGGEVASAVAADPIAEGFARRWSEATGHEAVVAMRQRLHALDVVPPTPTARGSLRLARPADVELIAGWVAAFEDESFGSSDPAQARTAAERRIGTREVFVWEDEAPRAMAGRARPTRRTVSVNAVYTPPELRGRGFATACVAALSRRLLAEGASRCVLFTDLANPTSNAIYARIGYRPLLDFTLHRFAA